MGKIKMQNTPTIRRMPSYLHKLYMMRLEGAEFVSCTELARYMNVELIVARKDIAATGLAGHRRHGYKVNELIDAIREYLGWSSPITATLVGAGALGNAILGYDDFKTYGLEIESVFDADPGKIGREARGHVIFDAATLETRLSHHLPKIGIICVSNSAAQSVADRLIALGVRYIWNFANVCLQVPQNVVVQREVIAGGFALLAAKIKSLEQGCSAPAGD